MPTQNDIMARQFRQLLNEMMLERQRKLDSQLRVALHAGRLIGPSTLQEKLKALFDPKCRTSTAFLPQDLRSLGSFVSDLVRTYPEQFENAVQSSDHLLERTNLAGVIAAFTQYGAWPRGFRIATSMPPQTLSRLRSVLEDSLDDILRAGQAVVNADGTLSVGDYAIPQDEIVSEVNRIFPEPFSPDQVFVPQQLYVLIDRLIVVIPQSENWLKVVLYGILASLVAGLILMAPAEYRSYKERGEYGSYKKSLEEQVRREMKHEYLTNYRIVTAKHGLWLREGPSKKTKKVRKLCYGELVEVKRKNKDWCYVAIREGDDNQEVNGWASITHLDSIKRQH